MKKLGKARIPIISFILALIICATAVPFSSATYTERDKIIDIAMSEIGYTQKDGYNKFSAAFGNGYTAWCNYFVVWCARKAGISPEAITGTSSYDGNCTIYMNALKNQGRFFENDGSYTPQKGDLVFYNSNKSTASSIHVGFVLSADENTVTTIEGNISVGSTRGVGKNVRNRYSYVGNMIITGFGVPAYSGEEIPKIEIKKTASDYNQSTYEKQNQPIINAEKFETCASVDERIKLGEAVRTVSEKKESGFTCILNPNPIKNVQDPCVGVLCNCE